MRNQERVDTIVEIIVLLIAVTATSFAIIKYNGNKANGNAPVTESVESNDVFYVPCMVTRGVDYIEVEYCGDMYSAWIDSESEIQTGDYVWAGFYIYNNEFKLVDFRLAHAFH